jgi:zinc/manganese transport system substrate-binding protein
MTRKASSILMTLVIVLGIVSVDSAAAAQKRARLQVVTTLADYALFAEIIGGDRVSVEYIVHAVQDPHRIRPKPSYVNVVKNADLLIATGLDLEMWLPTVVNKSGNKRVRSGEIGYVAVAQGIELVEKPKVISQIEGDVHIFGNPHITCSPINMKRVARNIATGLIKNDLEGKDFYEQNLKKLHDEIDIRMFGEELVKLIGGRTLCRITQQGNLMDFLQKEYKGQRLIEKLGGWMGKMLPLRGERVVVYHLNWSYFLELFGLEQVATMESKPGIPPSPKHLANVIKLMRERKVSIILAAMYFDERKVNMVAGRTGAQPVLVPLYIGAVPGTEDYFKLMDYWTNELLNAAKKKGMSVTG